MVAVARFGPIAYCVGLMVYFTGDGFMKNIYKIFGFVLAFLTGSGFCATINFKNLREHMIQGAGRGIQFRFTNPNFEFEDLLNKCGGHVRKFECSFKRYFLDLYQGKISNHERERDACALAMKAIKEKISKGKTQKHQPDLWNNIVAKFVEPISLALYRFGRVKTAIVNGEQVPEIIWGNFIKEQVLRGMAAPLNRVIKQNNEAWDTHLDLQQRAEFAQFGLSFSSRQQTQICLFFPTELYQMIEDLLEEFYFVKLIIEQQLKNKR
jgi:hypothetical protein